MISIGKIGGDRTRFNSNFSYKSPGFDINDLGYLERADEISQSNWFQLRSDTPNRWRRSININFNQWAGWNFDGDFRYGGGIVNVDSVGRRVSSARPIEARRMLLQRVLTALVLLALLLHLLAEHQRAEQLLEVRGAEVDLVQVVLGRGDGLNRGLPGRGHGETLL